MNIYGLDLNKLTDNNTLLYEEQENIVTVLVTNDFLFEVNGELPKGVISPSVKFYLDSKRVAIKVYKLIQAFDYNNHPPLPIGSRIMGWASYYDFVGYEFPEHLANEIDLLYSNESVENVKSFYNIDIPSNKTINTNFYGIRYAKDTLDVIKAKIYSYSDTSSFGLWYLSVKRGEEYTHNRELINSTMRLTPYDTIP